MYPDPVLLLRLCAVSVLLSSVPVEAQSMAWQLEADQAVRYLQEDKLEILSPDDAAEQGWSPRMVREENPPVVFGGELDPGRQFVDAPIFGARIIARRLAFDLRHAGSRGGRQEYLIPFNNETRSHRIEARFHREDRDGSQRITARIEPAPEDDPGWESEVRMAQLRGTLEITRQLDRERGLVSGFHSELVVEWRAERDEDPVKRARVRRIESWSYRDILEADTPVIRKLVSASIADGVGALWAELRDPSAHVWGYGLAGPREYTWSREAELLHHTRTLVELGEDRKDPALATALRMVRRAEHLGLQSRSAAIRAIAELYVRPGERMEIASGLLEGPVPRGIQGEDRVWLAERTAALVEQLTARGEGVPLFTYPGDESWSIVEAEQPLRALEAAHLCGVPVPVDLWRRAGRFFLDRAVPEVDPVALEFGFVNGSSRRIDLVPIGWKEADPYRGVGGTSTAIATAGCLRIAAVLKSVAPTDRTLIEALDAAADGGLAWLGREWTALAHPGLPFHWAEYRARWLETAAQAFERAGVRSIDGRDWYFEAAVVSLGLQYPVARTWAGAHDTCRTLGVLRPQLAGPSTSR